MDNSLLKCFIGIIVRISERLASDISESTHGSSKSEAKNSKRNKELILKFGHTRYILIIRYHLNACHKFILVSISLSTLFPNPMGRDNAAKSIHRGNISLFQCDEVLPGKEVRCVLSVGA
mmetsp:Transcript_3319/g.4502  ORF Transcript_3319/g.4502 Transcript_3319/m.4502 type:complete len:120 (+) Transcript_3319:763-1122(+)